MLDMTEEQLNTAFGELPEDKVSEDMFYCDLDEVGKDEQALPSQTPASPSSLGSASTKKREHVHGGPSLLFSHEDLNNVIPTSATISLGAEAIRTHTQVLICFLLSPLHISLVHTPHSTF